MPRIEGPPITETAGANYRNRYRLDSKPDHRWIADLIDASRPGGVIDVEVDMDPPAVIVTFEHAAAGEVHEWAPKLIEGP